MNQRNDHYAYRVLWSQDDQEYVGLCAEFPSLSWLAESQDAAWQGIRTLVAEVIHDMQANGEPLPIPFADKSYSGNFQIRIPSESQRNLEVRR